MASEPELPEIDTLWDYDQPAATEQRLSALVSQAAVVSDRGYYAELLSQIARAQGLQRLFAAAHATLDTAQALLTPELGRAQIRYLLERGRVFKSAGQPDMAQPLFLEAWQAAQAQREDFYAIDAAHMLGIVSLPTDKLAWEQRALALAEASEQPRAQTWRASLYNNMGWSYHELGEHVQALSMFQRALAARETAGTPEQIQIARWSVARALRSLGRYDQALEIQRAIAQTLKQAGASDGYVDEELGECLLALGRNQQAATHFARAYAALARDAWLAANEPARLERLKRLAAGAEIGG